MIMFRLNFHQVCGLFFTDCLLLLRAFPFKCVLMTLVLINNLYVGMCDFLMGHDLVEKNGCRNFHAENIYYLQFRLNLLKG